MKPADQDPYSFSYTLWIPIINEIAPLDRVAGQAQSWDMNPNAHSYEDS